MTVGFDEYIEKLSRAGTYADHICLKYLQKVVKSTIKIVRGDADDTVIGDTEPTLFLGYISDTEHYVSLEPIKR